MNVVQSEEVKYPLTELVAAGIDIVLFVLKSPPPVNGADAVMVVAVLTLLLNVVQSDDDNAPLAVEEAVGTFNVITGVVVPLATLEPKSEPLVPKVNAATDVTVPVLKPVILAAKVPVPASVNVPDE